jgi:tRNA threonylcarbamoyladenosine biosynthesis protein TsaB
VDGAERVLILGIETATQQVGVAIGGHEGVIASFHCSRDRRHAETLAPAIRFLCDQAKVELDDIGAVAVDIGPGLFTGLRVGLATAKAIAHARRIPMVGISSLDLAAFPARFTDRLVVSMIDARRGEVFYATYRRVPGGIQRVSEPHVDQPADIVDQLIASGDECLLVGDGAQRYADVFGAVSGVEVGMEGFRHPTAGSLVELAHARALREEFVTIAEIEPMYLRAPDARINWQQRERS